MSMAHLSQRTGNTRCKSVPLREVLGTLHYGISYARIGSYVANDPAPGDVSGDALKISAMSPIAALNLAQQRAHACAALILHGKFWLI